MNPEGVIASQSPRQGLFVYQPRMLSRYRWRIDGKDPQLSTQSPVEQHSWLAYYFQAPRNCRETPAAECNPLQQTIELRIARVVGEGMHEDVELINHTQIHTSVSLQLEVDVDFASRREIKTKRPMENGSFVLGMARYGLHGEMWQLARVLFEAATLFDYDRLPEVFGGHARDKAHPFPCLYERADSPQAWSASAPFVVLQALLGLYPYAPLNVLFLDPWLPEWLPEVRLENLRIGQALLDLRFKRNQEGRTDYEILSLARELHVLRQPSPWSLTANWGERVKDAVMSLLPAK